MKPTLHIDYHIVAMLLLLFPAPLFLIPFGWAIIIISAMPQGRILTRVFDLRGFHHPVRAYVLLNEFLLLLIVLFCWAWRYIAHKT